MSFNRMSEYQRLTLERIDRPGWHLYWWPEFRMAWFRLPDRSLLSVNHASVQRIIHRGWVQSVGKPNAHGQRLMALSRWGRNRLVDRRVADRRQFIAGQKARQR